MGLGLPPTILDVGCGSALWRWYWPRPFHLVAGIAVDQAHANEKLVEGTGVGDVGADGYPRHIGAVGVAEDSRGTWPGVLPGVPDKWKSIRE